MTGSTSRLWPGGWGPLIRRFSTILIKILMAIFIEVEKTLLKFIWNHKRLSKAKDILRKKNRAGCNTLLDFKLYDKAILIKTVWYWHKNRCTDQWTRIEHPRRNPCIYGQLIFNKRAENVQRGKDSLFNKWCWENWTVKYKILKLDHYLFFFFKLLPSLCGMWNLSFPTRDQTHVSCNGSIET